MQPGGQLDLTVVVPYYNPGPNLSGLVAQVIEVLRDRGISFEIIAVSDGSTDGSDVGLAELGRRSKSSTCLSTKAKAMRCA